MSTSQPGLLRRLTRRARKGGEEGTPEQLRARNLPGSDVVHIDVNTSDPIYALFQEASGAVDLESLELDSPLKKEMEAAGIRMVVPLISQGELVGLLNLGTRRSEEDYSAEDRRFLSDIASHAAPAVRLAQLIEQRQLEIRDRDRLEQEMRLAQLIQQQFLPKELPELEGWELGAFYRPARAVGGDFYDFVDLPEGRIGVIAGDVTDKGVPAALVMATTHSLLRSEARRLISPGAVLARANDALQREIPERMFVTCLYGVLDPSTGEFVFANAGHNLPFVSTDRGVVEYRATGMPLGLMPGLSYEETVEHLEPGDLMLLHSDGLAEAHSEDREMFGFAAIKEVLAGRPHCQDVIAQLLAGLDRHTGDRWDQEDDITLVTLQRTDGGRARRPSRAALGDSGPLEHVATFTFPSEPGTERPASEQVLESLAGISLEPSTMQRLKSAVAEGVMNAIEHGNQSRPELPVEIRVETAPDRVEVRITDQGGVAPDLDRPEPNIEAKLAGLDTPRGWGLFLMKRMADRVEVDTHDGRSTLTLVFARDPQRS